ncbi:MAG: mercury methylation corrinoid protein HgcA [Thermodesulfobacteriota bacterium]
MPDMDTEHVQRPMRASTSTITLANRWDHFLALWGYKRNHHLVEPGLYSLGNPSADSPVFVTANYTLSFDALRSALPGIDGYIMVLDTKGINVWCAAGKGTFSTDELINRIELTELYKVVNHRVLILPQLGATGVAAHEVVKRSGFRVEYGPVRAMDLPEYLKNHQATPAMRRVRFNLADRLLLIPVEVVHVLLPMAIAAVLLFFFAGLLASVAAVSAIMAGAVLFPILLPWLPTSDFSLKGYILGGSVAFPFAVRIVLGNPDTALWPRALWALIFMLAMPPVTAYLALNFTGSTPFTSKPGVRREIFAYTPIMALMFGISIVLVITGIIVRWWGGA